MPIYEYTCSKCDCTCEKININYEDIEIPICENCNVEMERIISKTTFQLKGNGWANDGYSTPNPKPKDTECIQ